MPASDVFRINMSHTPHDLLRHACIVDIRSVEAKLQRPDRHSCRSARPENPHRNLRRQGSPHQARAIHSSSIPTRPPAMPRASIFRIPRSSPAAKEGDSLLLNDGRLRVEIIKVELDRLTTRVIFGGTLSDRKGVNLPDTVIPIPALTEKDRSDLEAAAEARRRLDRAVLRAAPGRCGGGAQADRRTRRRHGQDREARRPFIASTRSSRFPMAIMVARGDLGVELPLEAVPGKQKQITRAARTHGQAGGRRHADAGIDDRRAGADSRRSLRRRDRRL